jgi:hypothetical protein
MDKYYADNSVCIIPGANGVLNSIVCPSDTATQVLILTDGSSSTPKGEVVVFRNYDNQLLLSPRFFANTDSPPKPMVSVHSELDGTIQSSIFVGTNLISGSTSNYDNALNRAGYYSCATTGIDLANVCVSGQSKFIPNVLGTNSNCRCNSTGTFDASICPPMDVTTTTNLFFEATYLVYPLDDSTCAAPAFTTPVTLTTGLIQLSSISLDFSTACNGPAPPSPPSPTPPSPLQPTSSLKPHT